MTLPDLTQFRHALTLMDLALGPKGGQLVIQVPREAWSNLKHQAALLAVHVSLKNDCDGIVHEYQPPEGKNWADGFWLHGHWVEALP